ncbi:MAG: hypothetical protein WC476_01270 [Phycisphaerae bacterium]|jgi:hypothetical protein
MLCNDCAYSFVRVFYTLNKTYVLCENLKRGEAYLLCKDYVDDECNHYRKEEDKSIRKDLEELKGLLRIRNQKDLRKGGRGNEI